MYKASRYLKTSFSGLKLQKILRKFVTSAQLCSTNADLLQKYEVGHEIAGFTVREVKTVPELQLIAVRLDHTRTGADYLHVAREDSNNVFCIGFRTTPMDSTGVPHILEHNVLCGSQRFPCRDPFFKMLNRSLSTFMNAMTGSDYTIYPFSTQNGTDFRNLMSVYLDAVLKPNLAELDFLQEGWRLEHEDPTDSASPIIFKGVVFNEMKGVFADSQQLFMQRLQNGLLPSHTYGYISGGDPLKIPDLTWENLKKFHASHYHPSNSRIFTYGDLPLENHLQFINEEYLSKFEKTNPNTTVPSEPKWSKPRASHIGCSFDPMITLEKQTTLAVSYLLTDVDDNFENFVLAIIGELLIGGPNAPFYKTLIESGLGTSYSPVAGFDGHTRNTSFTVGLQGIDGTNISDISTAIERTFDHIVREGFLPERVESILHNIELNVKHQTSNFGLGLAMNLTPLWNHGGDLVNALSINAKIEQFRNILKENPKYLQDKVKHYFIDNQHKFTLTMSPEDNFEQKLSKAEEELLHEKISGLSDKDKKSIWNNGQVLKSKQEMKEDISCLPTLKVSDIPKSVPPVCVSKFDVCGGVPLSYCVQPTNGVTYFNAVLSTKELPRELIELVPLFCTIMTSMGAGDMDFRALTHKSEMVSGGLASSFHLTEHPDDPSLYEEGIHISSHCLQKNFSPMLELWSEVLNRLRLDDLARFSTLLKMIATEKANSLVYSGHSYAMAYASSSTSYVSHMKEQIEGLTYLQHLKQLSDNDDASEVLHKMKLIAEHLLSKNRIRVAVHSSKTDPHDDVKLVESFLNVVKGTPTGDNELPAIPSVFTPSRRRTHHVFSFPVNFSAKSFAGLPYSHQDSGPLRILARLMFQYLHREIREKGGAYGGGAVSQPGGPFHFFSYRDPHSTRTLKTFEDAIEWVLAENFTQRDVDEAKLGVFQKVDSPVSPGAKGLRPFLYHVSDEMFSSHRGSILRASSDDLIRVCRTHLKGCLLDGTCLIGPQNEALNDDPSWNVVKH